MIYNNSRIAFDYILKNRTRSKRVVFDIEYLEEWLDFLEERGFLFVNQNDKQEVDGVITIFPIGRWKKTPTMHDVITNINNSSVNDYFIMDALVDNPDARRIMVNNILKSFPDIEKDPNCQIWACRKGKVRKFNKHTILTLKN